jgi:hypothetical protein
MTNKAQAHKKHALKAKESAKSSSAETGGPASVTPPLKLTANPGSKTDKVIALLQRSDGATLDELVAATGWQPHTTRAALTGLKKKGHVLSSEKIEGVRRYRATAPL